MYKQPPTRLRILMALPLVGMAATSLIVTSPADADDSAYDPYREALAAVPALPPIPADKGVNHPALEIGNQFAAGKSGARLIGGIEAVDDLGLDTFAWNVGETTAPELLEAWLIRQYQVAALGRQRRGLLGSRQPRADHAIDRHVFQGGARGAGLVLTFLGQAYHRGVARRSRSVEIAYFAVSHQIYAMPEFGAVERHVGCLAFAVEFRRGHF